MTYSFPMPLVIINIGAGVVVKVARGQQALVRFLAGDYVPQKLVICKLYYGGVLWKKTKQIFCQLSITDGILRSDGRHEAVV